MLDAKAQIQNIAFSFAIDLGRALQHAHDSENIDRYPEIRSDCLERGILALKNRGVDVREASLALEIAKREARALASMRLWVSRNRKGEISKLFTIHEALLNLQSHIRLALADS